MNRKIFFLTFLGGLILLSFQNCGDGFLKQEFEEQESGYERTPLGLNEGGNTNLNSVVQTSVTYVHEGIDPYNNYTMPPENSAEASFTILRDREGTLSLEFTLDNDSEILIPQMSFTQLSDYFYPAPRVFALGNNEFLVLGLHNNAQRIFMGKIENGRLNTLLTYDFPNIITIADFISMPVMLFNQAGTDIFTFNLQNHVADVIQSNNPTVTNCGNSMTAVGRQCVANQVGCTVTNGTGVNLIDYTYGQRQPTYSPTCENIVCNSGYGMENGQCLLTCAAGSTRVGPIDDAQCLADVRTCTIANGTGTQTLQSDGTYGACMTTDCNNTYIYLNGQCVPEDSCLDSSRQSEQTITINFPSRANCAWGVNGNLSRRGGYMRAIAMQTQNINVPSGHKLCSIDIRSTKSSFRYDDEFVLTFNNYLLVSSANYASSFESDGGGRLIFDWTRIRNTRAPSGDYCYRRNSGQSTCSLPNTDTNGNFNLQFNDGIIDNLRGDTNVLEIGVMGDDDNGDCYHNGLPLTIDVTIGTIDTPDPIPNSTSTNSNDNSGSVQSGQ